jgi:pyruvate carboxylase
MKLAASITAPAGGRIARLAITGPRQAEAGDLIAVLDQ